MMSFCILMSSEGKKMMSVQRILMVDDRMEKLCVRIREINHYLTPLNSRRYKHFSKLFLARQI